MTDNLTLKPNLSRRAQILHDAHGWSMNLIVTTYSLSMLCELPAFLVGGMLINKFGMKKILTICGVLYGLSILVSGLATNVFVFIMSQGIMGALSMYGIFIATLSLINVLYPDRKGLVMGVL